MRILDLFWKNADYRGSDYYNYSGWGPTGWGWTLIAVLVIAIIVYITRKFQEADREIFKEQCEKIRKLGYKDVGDIQVFLNRVDANIEDFIKSQGIRKQYEIFRDGKSSDFIKTAESNKKADDAESTGRTSGLATGIIIGNAMHSGR